MKPTAYLINVARGPIVDQEALVDALRTAACRARASTCSSRSRSIPGPLLSLDNVILTPTRSAGPTNVSA
jgi:phosphoglycerate dehydrogenase-like enzyme